MDIEVRKLKKECNKTNFASPAYKYLEGTDANKFSNYKAVIDRLTAKDYYDN